ncbi:MAG: hypothetical protein CL678_04015 [Bdellovibrionaceae bacterium]|nr:hypothetical protein [Pseudobdellovibrionaceae bacterium]|tara:strand:+ start:260 stop:892 length:633 start_codon:yes stop_codon:yes gene_type:complete
MSSGGDDDADMTDVQEEHRDDLLEIPGVLFRLFKNGGKTLEDRDIDNIKEISITLAEKIKMVRSGDKLTWDYTYGVPYHYPDFPCMFSIVIEPGEQTRCIAILGTTTANGKTKNKHIMYPDVAGKTFIVFSYGREEEGFRKLRGEHIVYPNSAGGDDGGMDDPNLEEERHEADGGDDNGDDDSDADYSSGDEFDGFGVSFVDMCLNRRVS